MIITARIIAAYLALFIQGSPNNPKGLHERQKELLLQPMVQKATIPFFN